MSEDEDLELYYIVKIRQKGMPEFKDLSESQKQKLKNTSSFAIWLLNESGKKFIGLIEWQIKKFVDRL